jgi:hypothetical protein
MMLVKKHTQNYEMLLQEVHRECLKEELKEREVNGRKEENEYATSEEDSLKL